MLRCIHLDDSVIVLSNPDPPVALYYLPVVKGREALWMVVCDTNGYSRRVSDDYLMWYIPAPTV